MDIASAYPAIKTAHIGLVVASGSLFALRGAAVQLGAAWPMQARWRRLSVLIDSLLLAAGVGLWALLQIHPLQQTWLGTKLALLLLYIVLGAVALRHGRRPWLRRLAYAAALAVFVAMLSVARSHSPLGLLAWLR